MKNSILIFALAASPSFGAGPAPVPLNWTAFKASAADKQLVASIEKMDDMSVCLAWGNGLRAHKTARKTAALRELLLHNQWITGIDLLVVAEREYKVGMSMCGVIASIGRPSAINYTTNLYGTTSQMIYRDKGMYFYADENNIVTTIQH